MEICYAVIKVFVGCFVVLLLLFVVFVGGGGGVAVVCLFVCFSSFFVTGRVFVCLLLFVWCLCLIWLVGRCCWVFNKTLHRKNLEQIFKKILKGRKIQTERPAVWHN